MHIIKMNKVPIANIVLNTEMDKIPIAYPILLSEYSSNRNEEIIEAS